MTKEKIFDDSILPIVSAMAPLRVDVKVRCIKNKYYMHFDGGKTYVDPHKWVILWDGFDRYVKEILRQNGFKNYSIKLKGESHAVVYIGSLFDFLKNENNG